MGGADNDTFFLSFADIAKGRGGDDTFFTESTLAVAMIGGTGEDMPSGGAGNDKLIGARAMM